MYKNTPIYIFLPQENIEFPNNISEYWSWLQSGNAENYYWGRYHWVLQTYLTLKETQLNIILVTALPNNGIIVTHRDFIDATMASCGEYYIVSLLVDRTFLSAYADIHVTHNSNQKFPCLPYYLIPPFPQQSLLKRNKTLNDRFEVIGYFGDEENLDPTLKTTEFLKKLALPDFAVEVSSCVDLI